MKGGSFFFFSSRRRHTRYWRDWSSDVCSSDLMTNNSSSSKKQYLDKFKALGIEVTAKEVLTSTDATLRYLKLQKMKRIVLLATPEVEEEFEEAGFLLVKERGLEVDCVVLTFDVSLTYEKIWTA